MFILVLIMGSGCANSHRLGESRVESRRYSRGWHVNVPNLMGRDTKTVAAEESASPPTLEKPHRSAATRTLSTSTATTDDLNITAGIQDVFEGNSVSDVWAGYDRPHSSDPNAAPLHGNESMASSDDSHLRRMEAMQMVPPSPVPLEEGLPEPELGRHPLAVPGFVLSLGWILGLAGAIALDYLGVSAPGLAFLLGLILSGFGYFESRKALRASRENPDLYPRSGLAKAGRWIALVPFGAMALYIILILGILLTW